MFMTHVYEQISLRGKEEANLKQDTPIHSLHFPIKILRCALCSVKKAVKHTTHVMLPVQFALIKYLRTVSFLGLTCTALN